MFQKHLKTSWYKWNNKIKQNNLQLQIDWLIDIQLQWKIDFKAIIQCMSLYQLLNILIVVFLCNDIYFFWCEYKENIIEGFIQKYGLNSEWFNVYYVKCLILI